MKLPKVAQRFRYSEDLNKWFWFAVETMVAAVVGTLIAFVFGGNYWAAIYTFAVLMLFLLLLVVAIALLENRVSILSIMKQGLKDGRYEDVIKFGSALRGTLFTSNKNEDIVMLGAKIDEAASRIESAHYNAQKGDYSVTVDGRPKTIIQIRAGLKIDDLGWSMHLCKRTEEAVANIGEGMRIARYHATRLSAEDSEHSRAVVTSLVQLILRGYRHLSGIYYENVDEHWRAMFYEDVTKSILSNSVDVGAYATCAIGSGKPKGTTCGATCDADYKAKVACARKNIVAIYFGSDDQIPCGDDVKLRGSSVPVGGLLSQAEVEDDIALFRLLPQDVRHQVAREQCYAWSRNIVKRLQNGMYSRGGLGFIADGEFTSLVAEARAFSQIYYYGVAAVPDNDDFDSVIKQPVVGKSELRYASLMSEIELAKLLNPGTCDGGMDLGRNTRIEKLIDNLRATREISRDRRADLYVRASAHLITAYHLEYNLNHRYLTNEAAGRSLESRKQVLQNCRSAIERIYKEIVSYERRPNRDLRDQYALIVQDLREAEEDLKRKYRLIEQPEPDPVVARFASIDSASYAMHMAGERLTAAAHDFGDDEVARVKSKWEYE